MRHLIVLMNESYLCQMEHEAIGMEKDEGK